MPENGKHFTFHISHHHDFLLSLLLTTFVSSKSTGSPLVTFCSTGYLFVEFVLTPTPTRDTVKKIQK